MHELLHVVNETMSETAISILTSENLVQVFGGNSTLQ